MNDRPKRSVLVVDDDPMFRRIARHWFEEGDLRVEAAGSGHDALSLAVRRPPQCVVLDVHLGSDSGLEMIRPLATIVPLAPIVMVSADPDWTWAARALCGGAFVCWRKGCDSSELERAVQLALEEHEVRAAGGVAVAVDPSRREDLLRELSANHGSVSQTINDLSRQAASIGQMARAVRHMGAAAGSAN